MLQNTTMSFNIARAHSYAFICWGVADLILAFLLVLNTVEHLRKHHSVFITLLRSSILRMSVLIVNTAVISIVGQFSDPSPTISNINTIAWTIKGSYPVKRVQNLIL
ncbi:hypothetical protein HDV02_001913 [Globomyces sp. JEL0801]|nr:hypothetical protein HDV02_001913 [Globomyces sp. JEL0801]